MDTQIKKESVQISSEELDTLTRRFSPALTRFFRRRGCQSATVEDLVQDVFLRLAARKEGESLIHAEAYIMRAASNVWRDFLRKRQSHMHALHDEYDERQHAETAVSPEDIYQGKEAVHQLVDVLKNMPEKTRQVFILCRLQNMKQKDVAKRLSVSEGFVSKHMVKATAILTDCFGGKV